MIKLHPDTAQEIANLINTIDCSDLMYTDADNIDNRIYWQATGYKAIIKLKEEYGIPHVQYDSAVRNMSQDWYANATLTEAA